MSAKANYKFGEIALVTGLIDVLHPTPKIVKVWDFAWGMHNSARWSGHTPVFWDVLSHTGLVLQLAKRELGPKLNPIDEIGILLHDASEGMGLTDIPTPIKYAPEFEFYRQAERLMMDAIFARFGLKYDDIDWEVVDRYDKQCLYVEWEHFFSHFRGHRSEVRPVYPIDVKKLGILCVAKPTDYVEHLRHLTINLAETHDIPDINDLFMMPDTLLPYVRPQVDPLDEPVVDADILGQGV